MRIAISLLNFRPGMIGGAETYIRRLLEHLPRAAVGHTLMLVLYGDIAETIRTPGYERIVVDRSDRRMIAARIMEAYTPLRARFAERAFDKAAADVVFFPQQSIFPRTVRGPCVMTVVDVQHLFFPEYFGLFDRTFRARVYPRSLRRADHIVAISEYTRKTVIERCGVPAERITAVPFGTSGADVSQIEPTDKLPRPYLYYPAATFPHKNHRALLRTFAALRKRGGFPYKLVLTGRQTPEWTRLQALIAELGLKEDVIHPGFIPFEEVLRVYRGAEAILFPTQFEGFGLPVLEAVEFNKKIVTSRLEVFDEIGVPRRFQIDFADPDELAKALAVPGPTRLEKTPATWPEIAARMVDIFQQTVRR
ncbi:MAG: glycosyltransferase family 4 protein [Phycisphaerae bacterium]